MAEETPWQQVLRYANRANPYPFYARLRAEAPVYRFTLRTLGKRDGWLVSRYADVLSVFKDPRLRPRG